MKLVYITDTLEGLIGVSKKVKSQLATFEEAGFLTEYKCIYNKLSKNPWYMKILRRINLFYPSNSPIDFDELKLDGNIFYIRYRPFDYPLFSMIKKIKKDLNGKVFLEIPTYPNWKEALNFKDFPYLIKNIIFVQFLHFYVDYVVTYSQHDTIYKIPTIKISNGIDIKPIRLKNDSRFSDTLKIIAVANVEFWHGYDRLVEGMFQYYSKGKVKVQFHIVGDGKAIPQIKTLVRKRSLENSVFFHGIKTGNELDILFDECHLAIGSLACHRKDIFFDSSLKTREYCARGIPFVNSSKIDDIPVGFPYLYYVPQDETPIDIPDIINFITSIYEQKENMIFEMRKFAENELNWKKKMASVVQKMIES